jgi:hypothetical protein
LLHRRRAPVWGLILAAGLAWSCSDESDEPRPRMGAPLAVTPSTGNQPASGPDEPTLDAGGPSDAAVAADSAVTLSRPEASLSPHPARALVKAAEGDQYAADGQLARAAERYELACALDPSSPWMRVAYGWFLSRRGDTSRARDELERALDLAGPDDPLLVAAIRTTAPGRERATAWACGPGPLRRWPGRCSG